MLQTVGPSEPRLSLDASACLPNRSTKSDCEACAAQCPVSALGVDETGPRLTNDCLGCGQCAAVCPTDALKVHGFPLLPLPQEESPPVYRVECWRVPEGDTSEGTLRIPCLGGLEASQLVTLTRMAGKRGLSLVDRGLCNDCPAGCAANHPAAEALESCRQILGEAGMPAEELPRLIHVPLAAQSAARSIPSSGMEAKVGRRGFLRRLTGHAAAAQAATSGVARKTPATRALIHKLVPRRRNRLAEELLALGGRRSTPATRPRLSVNSDCEGSGICVAICPTGALTRETSDGSNRLMLDATHCIACGLCEQHCPHQAIHVAASEGGEEIVELNRLVERRCSDCGSVFTADGGKEAVCSPCRKSRGLAAAGFGLFAAGDAIEVDRKQRGEGS